MSTCIRKKRENHGRVADFTLIKVHYSTLYVAILNTRGNKSLNYMYLSEDGEWNRASNGPKTPQATVTGPR